MYRPVRLTRRLKIPVCTTTTDDLTQRNLRDTSLNSSLRQFSPRPPHEGDFDFLRYFWGFSSRFGRGVAAWGWSNLTEAHLIRTPGPNDKTGRSGDSRPTTYIYLQAGSFAYQFVTPTCSVSNRRTSPNTYQTPKPCMVDTVSTKWTQTYPTQFINACWRT